MRGLVYILAVAGALALAPAALADAIGDYQMTLSQPSAIYVSCETGNPDAAITDAPNDDITSCVYDVCTTTIAGYTPTGEPIDWRLGTADGLLDNLIYNVAEPCDPSTFWQLVPLGGFHAVKQPKLRIVLGVAPPGCRGLLLGWMPCHPPRPRRLGP
jgi:hypothetical protein